jgi:hypothetical protein
MRNKSAEVNARIILLAKLWLDGVYGVTTGDCVARLAGCSGPLVDAARIVWQSGDKALIEAVCTGRMSLTAAAAAYRYRVRLIQSFKKAGPEDRVALAHAIGPTELFDAAIAPALDDPAIDPVVTTETPIKSDVKTTNGNGSHLYVRPAEPRITVRVNTH